MSPNLVLIILDVMTLDKSVLLVIVTFPVLCGLSGGLKSTE